MSRFIVIHGVPREATQQELIAGAKTVAASLPAGTDWLNSWAAGPSGKMFCEWEAPNKDTIEFQWLHMSSRIFKTIQNAWVIKSVFRLRIGDNFETHRASHFLIYFF